MNVTIAMNDTLSSLWAYWRTKRGERSMPARNDIDPIEIPKLLPHILLLESSGGRLRYRLVGSAIVDEFELDPTGKFLDNLLPEERFRVASKSYMKVMELSRPIITRSVFTARRKNSVIVTRLLLPLSDDGKHVNMILAGLWFQHAREYLKAGLAVESTIDASGVETEML